MQKRGIFFYPYVAARAFLGYGCRFIYEHQTPLRGYWSVGNYRVLPTCRHKGFLGIWVSCSTHMSPQGLSWDLSVVLSTNIKPRSGGVGQLGIIVFYPYVARRAFLGFGCRVLPICRRKGSFVAGFLICYPHVARRAFLGFGCRFCYEHQTCPGRFPHNLNFAVGQSGTIVAPFPRVLVFDIY